MARIARVVVADYPHHVVQRGTNRNAILGDDEDRQFFMQLLVEWTQKAATDVWAYCLMDNHFHLVLVPKAREALGACLHGLTSRYAVWFNEKYDRCGRLWQNRYFSCPVDTDVHLWAVVAYVEANPVRAQIVSAADQWAWSSARAHLQGVDDQVLADPAWLAGARSAYTSFAKQARSLDAIRAATATGRPLGGMVFYQTIEDRTGRTLRVRRPGRPRTRDARTVRVPSF